MLPTDSHGLCADLLHYLDTEVSLYALVIMPEAMELSDIETYAGFI